VRIYNKIITEVAYFRFKSNNMLTKEVLQAKGIECDSRIARISQEQLKEILEVIQLLRKKKKNRDRDLEIAIQ